MFSIRGLLFAVAVFSLCLASLFRIEEIWSQLMLLGTIAGIVLTTVFAIFRKGPERATWGGFAIAAALTFVFVYIGGLRASPFPFFGYVLELSVEAKARQTAAKTGYTAVKQGPLNWIIGQHPQGPMLYAIHNSSDDVFRSMACMASLLFGLLGAAVAREAARRNSAAGP